MTRRGVSVARSLSLLAAPGTIAAVLDLAEHAALYAAGAGIAAVAFWAGRKPGAETFRVRVSGSGFRRFRRDPLPDAAGQVAELERLAGRPIGVIIASYRIAQARYRP